MDKPLPASPEIERLVLAAILVDSPGATAALESLHAVDFSTEWNRRIFSCMRALAASGAAIDRMTVVEDLQKHGKLESVGGLSYLVGLDDGMPPVLHVDGWLKLLREKAKLRRLADVGQHAVNRVLAGQGDAAEILADLTERLGAISTNGTGGRVADLEDIYAVDFSGVRYLVEPTLPEGALVAITGDAESGKSSLCTAWLRDIAAAGRPCLILDRDNPYQVVRDRCERLGVPENSIKVWGAWAKEYPPQPDSSRIVEWIRACKSKPAVMVDSLSGFIEGDENDSEPMLALMLRLRRITGAGATVVILHNTGKGDTTRDFRGHSSFKDKADECFVVTNMGADRLLDKVHVRPFKSRFGCAESLLYRYDDGKFTRPHGNLAVSEAVTQTLKSILADNPGAHLRRFQSLAMAAGIGRDKARDFLHVGIEFKEIRVEAGPRNTQRYFLIESTQNGKPLF